MGLRISFKSVVVFFLAGLLFVGAMTLSACGRTADERDTALVNAQQDHYAKVQPLPFYEFSIPRDIQIQIYNVVTQEARNTYTVIETITGQTKHHGPSIGYGIPADTSLTNPLKPAYSRNYNTGEIVEQPEPNGLWSSKNTDGTWVLFLDQNGDITPVYTEHKVTTFPYIVKQDENGLWTRADDKKATLTIKMKDLKAAFQRKPKNPEKKPVE